MSFIYLYVFLLLGH